MNPGIDQGVAPILLAPQTLLVPATKEVITDAELGGAWVNMTPWQVSQTGVDRSTPGNICHAVIVVGPPSPVLIRIVSTSPSCVINTSYQVANKRQSNSLVLVGQTQKLDAVVDRKFPDDLYSASIFSKVISPKLSNGSSGDLYTYFRVKFTDDSMQTQTPQYMDLGFSTINSLDESNDLSTPSAIILRPTYGSHWSVPDHVFDEATAVGGSKFEFRL